jgi:uncharacterized protein (TIGR04255 family)
VRFQSDVRASIVPGLVYAAVRERFETQLEGPGAKIPEELRAVNPALAFQPVVILQGRELSLHVAPRGFFLGMTGSNYPGWIAYREAMAWVLERVRPLKLIKIPERLGLRYTDFFEPPLKERLKVDFSFGDVSRGDGVFRVVYQFRQQHFAGSLTVDTGAALRTAKGGRPGIVLDVDLGFSIPQDKFWNDVLAEFDKAHEVQKELFYLKLLNPSFLATLSPKYD